MAGPQNQQPIIIVRKKGGGGHAGHHGGAWKVAYADFTTAMMSFFLLLWLLNTTTSDQRAGIAEYFAPAGISMGGAAAVGMFGSKAGGEGAIIGGSAPGEDDGAPTAGKGQDGDEDTPGKGLGGGNVGKPGGAGSQAAGDKFSGTQPSGDKHAGTQPYGDKSGGTQPYGTGAGGVNQVLSNASDSQIVATAMQREEKNFRATEGALRGAILESPELSDFANQLVVDRTTEGLRIQIVDQDKYSMFPSGSSIIYERARDLLRLVGKVVAHLPNRVSITGHTDAAQFVVGSRRDNWNLSTERANISRVELIRAGVDENRIEKVVGLADRDPLVPENPKDPRNRRISIVLLRQTLPPADPSASVFDQAPSTSVTVKPPASSGKGGAR